MKKLILAMATALISLHAGATTESVCKNKVASGRYDTTNKYDRLLPASKAAASQSNVPVRAKGAR